MRNVRALDTVEIGGMLAALFSETPEGALLARACPPRGAPVMLDDPEALVERVRSTPGTNVLLPGHTAAGVAVAPLVRECRLADPSVHVTVLVTPRPGIPRGIRRAIRAGASVETVRTVAEMRAVLRAAGQAGGLTKQEWSRARQVIRRAIPEDVQPFVVTAFLDAVARPSATEVAERAGMGLRTVTRRLLRHGLPGAAEMMDWARLLRAAVIRARVRDDGAVARAAGFTGTAALQRSVRTMLGAELEQLSLRAVAAAVRAGRDDADAGDPADA